MLWRTGEGKELSTACCVDLVAWLVSKEGENEGGGSILLSVAAGKAALNAYFLRGVPQELFQPEDQWINKGLPLLL